MGSLDTCALCGEEIYEADLRDVHEQWVGWFPKRGRKGGGANTKGKYPKDTMARAHGRCVEEFHSKQKRGVPVKQVGLF